MRVNEIAVGDELVSVGPEGAGFVTARFYRVVKVNRVTVDVLDESGRTKRVYPHAFDRKVAPSSCAEGGAS